MAKWRKGQSGNPNGRKKGAPNKVTHQVKQALIEALNEGDGAVAFFVKLKKSKSAEDRRCFANICSRMLPHEVSGPNGGAIMFDEPEMSSFEMARRILFALELAGREIEADKQTKGKP